MKLTHEFFSTIGVDTAQKLFDSVSSFKEFQRNVRALSKDIDVIKRFDKVPETNSDGIDDQAIERENARGNYFVNQFITPRRLASLAAAEGKTVEQLQSEIEKDSPSLPTPLPPAKDETVSGVNFRGMAFEAFVEFYFKKRSTDTSRLFGVYNYEPWGKGPLSNGEKDNGIDGIGLDPEDHTKRVAIQCKFYADFDMYGNRTLLKSKDLKNFEGAATRHESAGGGGVEPYRKNGKQRLVVITNQDVHKYTKEEFYQNSVRVINGTDLQNTTPEAFWIEFRNFVLTEIFGKTKVFSMSKRGGQVMIDDKPGARVLNIIKATYKYDLEILSDGEYSITIPADQMPGPPSLVGIVKIS